MKIQDKILLDYINFKTHRNPKGTYLQKVFCYKVSHPIPLEKCAECTEKCKRYRDLMEILRKHDYFGGEK